MNYEFITTKENLYKSIDKLSNNNIIAVDTETTGLSIFENNLLLIQISDKTNNFIYDCRKLKEDIGNLKYILENEDVIKILHNAKFDYKFLKYKYNIEMNNIYDTQETEKLIQNGLQKRGFALKDLISKYLKIEIDKTERESFIDFKGEFNQSQLEYAIKDVLYLFDIRKEQLKNLELFKLENVHKMEMALIPVIAEMEINGMKVDKENWKKLITKYEKLLKEKKEFLEDYIKNSGVLDEKFNQMDLFSSDYNFDINLDSPKQLSDILKKLDYKCSSTNIDELEKYKDDKFIKQLIEYKTYSKILSSFGESFLEKINKKTGRIHTEFFPLDMLAGRIASRHPNMQQIPNTEEFRSLFISEKGYKLIDADYSQAELRILAEFSNDKNMLKAINDGLDLHKATASMMFNIKFDDITKSQRSQAKAINFGLAYGRGAGSLSGQLGVSYKEGKKLIDLYFKNYYSVKYWLDKQKKLAFDNLSVRTISNRIRRFKLKYDNEKDFQSQKASIERQGVNTPIQGSNADITKMALILLHNRLKGKKAFIINTVHDEIIVECKEEISDEISKIVRESMIDGARYFLKKVSMEVDLNVNTYWEH
jgi:DNA polymerase-1